MRAYRIGLASLLAVTWLAGCGGTSPTAPPKPAASAPKPVARPAAEAAKVATPPPQAPVFAYDPTGLRDPFEPFIKIEEKKPQAPKSFVPKTELQRYSVEELKLVAIIWGEGHQPRALIEDPRGKGYVVKGGEYVGDRGGKIVRIQPDRIVVEERFTDLLGEVKVNVANMTLQRPESGVKP